MTTRWPRSPTAGGVVPIEPGVVLFGEGQAAEAWWVLLDGTIELVRRIGREDTVVARMDVAGRWAGGFRAWDENGTYLATGRGGRPGRVFRLPAEVLRDRFAEWFPFGAHLIGGVYHTARSIESTARQRSSLITLGTLAAGLAHELNNPASAATRAADALAGASRGVMDALARLSRHDITAAQFGALDELRGRADAAGHVRRRARQGRPRGRPADLAGPTPGAAGLAARRRPGRGRRGPRLVRPGRGGAAG